MIWRWLLNVLSQSLKPEEREAVLGDIAEMQLTYPQALSSIFGLTARRKLQPWKGWRPWLALIALIVPVGVTLGYAALGLAATDSVYFWMYASNWTPGYLDPGWILTEFIPEASGVALSCVILICWAWTTGLSIASLSRLSTSMNTLLISCALLVSTYQVESRNSFTPPPALHSTSAFTVAFYSTMIPLGVMLFLILLPAMHGLRQKRRMDTFSPGWKVLMWISVCVTALSLLSPPLALWLHRLLSIAHISPLWPKRLMPLAVVAPTVFFFATGKRRPARPVLISATQPTSSLP